MFCRCNPDDSIRHLERLFQQEPTPENLENLNHSRIRAGLPLWEHENSMRALLATGIKLRRVPGTQARMALDYLGLIKVTSPSAKLLFDAKIPLIVVGNLINSDHFFDNTRMAFKINSGRWVDEGKTFENFVNSWNASNEWTGQGKIAFFVNQNLLTF